jgi:hypothetical protein
VTRFIHQVRTLQHDDHRYYHQSRINQTLHLISALCFLTAYALLLIDPAAAGLVGWLFGMVTRQSGHLFFEPRGHDNHHNVSYAHKEAIKIGYNMRRKANLIGVWLLLPVALWFKPDVFGLIEPATGVHGYLNNVGLAWLALGVAGVGLRTVHLFVLRGLFCGLAWLVKILLDPFHNVAIYWRSPLALLSGEMLDPLTSVGDE